MVYSKKEMLPYRSWLVSLLARMLVGTLVLVALVPIPMVFGWSGADAYAIVLLTNFDVDSSLQERFYNAPNGTTLMLSREGYRLLGSLSDHLPHANGEKVKRMEFGSGEEDERWTRASATETHIFTTSTLPSSGPGDAPLPFSCRLSGEWVVWSRDGDHGVNPILLHCRLPLPQNRTRQKLLQDRYVARHHAEMASSLETWWHRAANEHASRCLFGDGEETLTGTERYYELCPAGAVYRIRHPILRELLRRQSGSLDGDSKTGMHKASPTVLDFLHTMHASPHSRNAVLQDPRYRSIFQLIGQYHPRVSAPRWNKEYRVWESQYPSSSACATHYSVLASQLKKENMASTNPAERAARGKRIIRPQDAYWKTIVRFRCPAHRPNEGAKKLSSWTVTEARQLCEYYVEVLSDLVCGWEQALDSFHVNPVPCVVLD